jgi:predicted porin
LTVRGVLVPRFFWGTYVKRTFISAVAVLAFAATAHADELTDIQAQAKQLREQNQAMTKRLADLEKRQKALEAKPVASNVNPVDSMAADLPYKAAVKARPPENDDLCWHGVCLYGNMDMGVAYEQHGNPYNAMAGGPLNYMVEKASNGSYAGVAANMMSTSFIGLRGKQEIADNLYAVFNLQTLYNPASGMNANGIGAVVQNNGLGASPQFQNANSYGDSSKAGQMFNNVAYFGVSSPTYGTFTMGRQSALTSDLVVNYDSLSGSNAWSAITFEGATGGGGVTEDRIYDNSYEYRLNVGPVRFAVEAQLRNGGNSATGNAFEGDVGFDYMGFSMDFVGGKIYDALAVGTTLSAAQNALLAPASGVSLGVSCSLGCVSGTISDNTVFAVAAKYTIGQWKLYGGYEHIDYANPNNPLQPGAFAEGGYNVGVVNDAFYQTDRVMNIFWAGVKYAVTPTFDVIGAYYGYRQNNFLQSGVGATVLSNPTPAGVVGAVNPANVGCNTPAFSGCSGSMDMFSLALDWRFARHMDVFAGVSYSQKTGGLANGYTLATTGSLNAAYNNLNNRVSTYDPGIGLRYQF